jgi:hypothetical protein
MALACQVALFKKPRVTAAGIAEYLPGVAVTVNEMKAVGTMLENGFGDLL